VGGGRLGEGVKVRITESSEISKGVINWNFTISSLRVYVHIEIADLTELVQDFADRGSSHRRNVVIYSIWFGYIARLSHWRGSRSSTC
jgi:hypothetical protein